MRSFLSLLLVVVLFVSGCSMKNSDEDKSMLNNTNSPELYYQMCGLSAYRSNENYLFSIIVNGDIVGEAEFASDRRIIRVESLELIKSDNIQKFTNMSFNSVKDMVGEPHVDVGSGFYIPAYITEDAHLICLYLSNEHMVDAVVVRDLLQNEIVERIDS